MINVTVLQIPGKVVDLTVNEGDTVSVALDLVSEINAEGFDIKVNGSAADVDTVLEDGDKVFLTRQIKGN